MPAGDEQDEWPDGAEATACVATDRRPVAPRPVVVAHAHAMRGEARLSVQGSDVIGAGGAAREW